MSLIINDPKQQWLTVTNGDKWFNLETAFENKMVAIQSKPITINNFEAEMYFLPQSEEDMDRVGLQLSDTSYFRGVIALDCRKEDVHKILRALLWTESIDEELDEAYNTLVHESLIEYEIV